MCYHASTPSTDLLKNVVKEVKVDYQFDTIYHVSGFSRPVLPVTLNDDIDSIVPARWKLIPYWVKSEEEADKYANTLNAVGEEVFEKPSYKNIIGKTRGLLYVTGFFEPHSTNGKKNDETYYVSDPESPIFTLGIVWNRWQDYNTFSILTTEANDFMADIHNVGKRMPLIIPQDKRHEWLLAEGKEEIQQLITPYDGDLKAHKTFRVTSARGIETNIPSIADPI